jgi:hypothetical protein
MQKFHCTFFICFIHIVHIMLVSLLVFQLHDISVTRLHKFFIGTFLFILLICYIFIVQVINGWISVILTMIGMFMVGHMVSLCYFSM